LKCSDNYEVWQERGKEAIMETKGKLA